MKSVTKKQKVFNLLSGVIATVMALIIGIFTPMVSKQKGAMAVGSSNLTGATFLAQMVELDGQPHTGTGTNADTYGKPNPYGDAYVENYKILGTFNKDITDNFFMLDDMMFDSVAQAYTVDKIGLRISLGEYGLPISSFSGQELTLTVNTAENPDKKINFASPAALYKDALLTSLFYSTIILPYNFTDSNAYGQVLNTANSIFTLTGNDGALYYVNNQGFLMHEKSADVFEPVVISDSGFTVTQTSTEITLKNNLVDSLVSPINPSDETAALFEIVGNPAEKNLARLKINAKNVAFANQFKMTTLPEGTYTINVPEHVIKETGDIQSAFTIKFNLLLKSTYFNADSVPNLKNVTENSPLKYELNETDSLLSYYYSYQNTNKPLFSFNPTKFAVNVEKYSFKQTTSYQITLLNNSGNSNLEIRAIVKDEKENILSDSTRYANFANNLTSLSFNLNKLGSYNITYKTLILVNGKYTIKAIDGVEYNTLNLMNFGLNMKYSNNKTEAADFYVKDAELDLDDLFKGISENGKLPTAPTHASQSADITETFGGLSFTSPEDAISGKTLVSTNQAPAYFDRVCNVNNGTIYYKPLNQGSFTQTSLDKNSLFTLPGTYVVYANFSYTYALSVNNLIHTITINNKVQVFAFVINHSNPASNVYENVGTNDSPVWKELTGDAYTNKQVKFTTTKASIFDKKPSYTFYRTDFTGTSFTLQPTATDGANNTINYIFSNVGGTGNDINGVYSIEVRWGIGEAYLTYQFIMDTTPITLLPSYQTKDGDKDFKTITSDSVESVEGNLKLSWLRKASKAPISAEYAFSEFIFDNTVKNDSTAVLKGDVSSATAVGASSAAWLNEEIYLKSQYKLKTKTAFLPYDENKIFTLSGIYEFKATDAAGNVSLYYIVLDKITPNIIELKGSVVKNSKTAPTYSVVFGNYKATALDIVDGSTTTNFVAPTKNNLGTKVIFGASSVFKSVTGNNSSIGNYFLTGINGLVNGTNLQETNTFNKRGSGLGPQPITNYNFDNIDTAENVRRKIGNNGFYIVEVKENEGSFLYSFKDNNNNQSNTGSIIINFDLSKTTIEIKNRTDSPNNYVNNVYPTILEMEATSKDYTSVDAIIESVVENAKFEMDYVKYNFYPLTYDSNVFSSAHSGDSYIYNKDSGINNLGLNKFINTINNQTREGLYIISRKYKEPFTAPTDIDGTISDTVERTFAVLIERNKIIDYTKEIKIGTDNKLILQNIKEFNKFDLSLDASGAVNLSLNTNRLPAFADLLKNKFNASFETTTEITNDMTDQQKAEITRNNEIIVMRNYLKNKLNLNLNINTDNTFSMTNIKTVYTAENKIDVQSMMQTNQTSQYYRNAEGFNNGGFFKADKYTFSLSDLVNDFIVEKTDNTTKTATGNTTNFAFKINNDRPAGSFYEGTLYENDKNANQNKQITHIELDENFEIVENGITNNITAVKKQAAGSQISFSFEDPIDEFAAQIDITKTVITQSKINAAGNLETTTIMPAINSVRINATRNRYFILLANDAEVKYDITLVFTGKDEDYQLNNATVPADKTYFNRNTYTVVVDETKPTHNVSSLIKPDKFLIDYLNYKYDNPNYIPTLPGGETTDEAVKKIIDELNKGDLKDYAFKIDSNFAFTKATTNKFGLAQENSAMLDTYKLFFRKVSNNFSGQTNYALPSVLPDEADYNTNNRPNQLQFNEANTAVYSKLKYDLPFASQLSLSTESENGYYEIIERDEAGNYRSYYIYLVKNAESASINLSFRNMIGGNSVKTQTYYATSEAQVINVIDSFKINSLNSKDLWFKITVQDLINNNTNVSFNAGSFNFNAITNFILDSLIYNQEVGNSYQITIQNRFGNNDIKLRINLAQKATLDWSSYSEEGSDLIYVKSPSFNAAHSITSLMIYKSVANGTLQQVRTDSLDRLITTAPNQSYTFNYGVYKIVQTDSFGRQTTKLITNVLEGNTTFTGTAEINNEIFATSNLNFVYQPLLYKQLKLEYRDLSNGETEYALMPASYIASQITREDGLIEVKFKVINNVNYEYRLTMISVLDESVMDTVKYNSKLANFSVLDASNNEQEFSVRNELRTTYGKLMFNFNNDNVGTVISGIREYTVNNEVKTINLGTLYSGFEFNIFGSTYYLTIKNSLGFEVLYTVKVEDEKFLVYAVTDVHGNILKPSTVLTTYNYNGKNYSVKQYFTNDAGYLLELSKTKDLIQTEIAKIGNTKYIYITTSPTNTSFSYEEIIKITVIDKTNTLAGLNLKSDGGSLNGETAKATSSLISYSSSGNNNGNYYFAEISYGSTFVMNNYTGSFTLTEPGEYRITFRDLAGNAQTFNNLPYLKFHIVSQIMVSVISDNFTGTLINDIVFNEKVALSIPNTHLYSKVTISGKFNAVTDDTINTSELQFTKFGYYQLTYKYVLVGSTTEYTSVYSFYLVGKNESKLGLEYNLPNNYNIYKVIKKGLSDPTDLGSDITDLIRENYGNSNKDINLTRFPLSSYTFGDGRYTVYVNVSYSTGSNVSFRPSVDYMFDVLISNGIPVIKSNVYFGEATTKKIVLTYNAGEIFASYGDINLKIYTAGKGAETILDLNVNAESVNETKTITIEKANTYFVELSYPNSSMILSRMTLIKKDPLNLVAIILISLGGVGVVVGIVLFIVLRNKMKVR